MGIRYREKLTYSNHIVILRALSYGEKTDIETIISHIGKEKVIEILRKYSHEIDKKSHHFWSKYFHLESVPSQTPSLYEQLNTPTFTRSFR